MMTKRSLEEDSVSDIDTIFKKAREESMAAARDNVPYAELNKTSSEECFGCKYFSEYNFKNNDYGPVLMKLFKIYKDNRLNLPSGAIAWQMKAFYDNVTYPKLPENMKQEWEIENIREHIDKHGFYPTSEIVEQITAYKNFRLMVQDLVWERDTDGRMFMNHQYMKLLVLINRQIVALMEKEKNIPDMIGYNKILKF